MIFGQKHQQQRNERILAGLAPEPVFPEIAALDRWLPEMILRGCWISPTYGGVEVGRRYHAGLAYAGGRLEVIPPLSGIKWPADQIGLRVDGFAMWAEQYGGRAFTAPVTAGGGALHADTEFHFGSFTITIGD